MNKILEILSKLGILRHGGTAGIYRNEAAPLDFEYMDSSRRKQNANEEEDKSGLNSQPESLSVQDDLETPLWVIIATWVLGALFWVVAIGAFIESNGLTGFWMTLAGLITVHHTNRLLAFIGVDLSPLWRISVVAVCLLSAAF